MELVRSEILRRDAAEPDCAFLGFLFCLTMLVCTCQIGFLIN